MDIVKVNENGGQRVLSSKVTSLTTNSRGPEDLPDTFCEEEAFSLDEGWTRARTSNSRWLVILVSSKIEIIVRAFFMSSTIL